MNIRSGLTIVLSIFTLSASLPALAEQMMEDATKKNQPWQMETIKKLPPDVIMETTGSKSTAKKNVDAMPGMSTNWSDSHLKLRR